MHTYKPQCLFKVYRYDAPLLRHRQAGSDGVIQRIAEQGIDVRIVHKSNFRAVRHAGKAYLFICTYKTLFCKHYVKSVVARLDRTVVYIYGVFQLIQPLVRHMIAQTTDLVAHIVTFYIYYIYRLFGCCKLFALQLEHTLQRLVVCFQIFISQQPEDNDKYAQAAYYGISRTYKIYNARAAVFIEQSAYNDYRAGSDKTYDYHVEIFTAGVCVELYLSSDEDKIHGQIYGRPYYYSDYKFKVAYSGVAQKVHRQHLQPVHKMLKSIRPGAAENGLQNRRLVHKNNTAGRQAEYNKIAYYGQPYRI